MSQKTLKFLILIFVMLLLAQGAGATTYYVDYSSGSDSNNGTSKTTPWKRAPGMNGCAAVCASTDINPGDSIILKGGVTWPAAALGWTPPGGANGSSVYIGVDQSWYAGTAWSRPVLSCGGAACEADNNTYILIGSYTIVDNIEFTGLYWTGGGSYCSNVYMCLRGTNQEVKNVYCHGWSHAPFPASGDTIACIQADTHVPSQNFMSSFHNSVCDGSDTDQASGGCIFGGPPLIYNNYIGHASNGMVINGATAVHDNLIEYIEQSFDPNDHENAIEDNADNGILIYNNVIRHIWYGAVTLWIAPNPGSTATIFNNVIYDASRGNDMDFARPVCNNACSCRGSYCANNGSFAFYNNTVECGPDSNPNVTCWKPGTETTSGGYKITNNHFISNAPVIFSCTGTCTGSNNVAQSLATAHSQGYSSDEALGFSSTNGSTIGKGLDLTDIITSNLTPLSDDTTYGCSYDSTAHAVTCPVKVPVVRLAPWNVGAYQSLSASNNPPQPPTGLSAVVQ